METIYHIAYPADWARAQADGEYRVSTRGATLAQQGFIHASTAAQVDLVANAVYAGEESLVLLVIDCARLGAEVVYEPAPGTDQVFPHIYGPLPVSAVVDVLPLTAGVDGRFRFGGWREDRD